MGLGFIIVGWLLIIGILFITWLASLLLFIWGRKRKSLILKYLGGIPLGISSFIGILLVLFFCYAVFMAGLNLLSPSYVFKDSFGFSPTQDVRHLKGYTIVFGDGSDTYLKFQAEPKTIDKIVNTRFKEISEVEFKEMMKRGAVMDPPKSWNVLNGQPNKFYATNDYRNIERSNPAILCYDTTSYWVYFHYWEIE